LYIEDTKFNKERIVPVSKSLLKILKSYSNKVHGLNSINQYFFPSPNGGHYSTATVYKFFREILWTTGISHSGRGPRVHDFRHTFAVHCLKKWTQNNEDLSTLLPYLSAYMGHVDLRATQHYLRLTSDLYPTIKTKTEDCCSYVIPEVLGNEE
jgi:integrase